MTEQQIEELAKVLRRSSPVKDLDTPVLDSKILNAAAKAAQETPSTVTNTASSTWRFPFVGLNNFSSAAFSIVLTAVVFIVLAKLIEVDESKVVAYTGNQSINNSSESSDTQDNTHVADNKVQFSKPAVPEQAPLLPIDNRDSILATMPLPSVAQMVGEMQFDMATDRLLAKESLVLAMADIEQLIREQNFIDARQRYQRLRRSCHVCELPDSLETLALSQKESPSNI